MPEGHDLLLRLGRALRDARERRALSVTELARQAGLSRRTLTEIEAGRANPSLLKLDGLARALGVDLGDLVRAAEPTKPRERIALVGLRGAGKSTLGRRLARELEVPFVELDERIEEQTGLTLAEIFDLHGREAFHRFEGEALEATLAEGGRLVIAAGGSIVDSDRNFARLCATCRTVWLSADPDDHFDRVIAQGDRRPMQDRPRAREELTRLLEERRDLYARADEHLHTSGVDEEQSFAELLRRVRTE